MENTQRITTLSRGLGRICTGLLYGLPVVVGLVWIFFNQLYAIAPMIPLPVHLDHDLPAHTRFYAFLVQLLPLGAVIHGLHKLRALFSLYENGSIFTQQNVDCFHGLGRALIIWVACHVVSRSLLSIVLTPDNPPGQRVIAVVLDSGDFAGVFIGVTVLIISWVLDEGRKILEHQSLIV